MLVNLGRYQEARPPFEEAVRLFHASADPEGEAAALDNLGNVHNSAGRFDLAIDAYTRALEVWRRLGSRRDEAISLFDLGNLYLDHGKRVEAQENYESGLRIAEAAGDDGLSADARRNLGEVAYREGRLAKSRAQSEQALALYRKLGDRRSQAITLISIGYVLLKTGEPQEAQARFTEALGLSRALGDAQGEAMATVHLARAALVRGEARLALQLGQDALTRLEKLGYRYGLSMTHYVMAQVLLRLKEPDKALHEVEASMELAESQRTETGSLETRASYFATRQHYWELLIDTLLELDRLHPDQGYAARALEADERRRARSLLDALAEARAEVRQHADPALLREEEEVQRRLDLAERPEETEALLARLDRVRTRMRQASPHLARLEGSKTLSVAEIQKSLLDTNTLLLVYSLGEERSVLWKVTRSTLVPHQLPGRERIETAARLVHDLLSQRLRPGSDRRQKAVDDLTALVLKPVAADLPRYRRLLIVADGSLQLVPFAALPDLAAAPAAGRQPLLVESHSIIMLPSASVGAALRQERRTRPPRQPGPLIAVLADPVFDASDPRVRPGSSPPPKREAPGGQLTRSLGDLGLSDLKRLPFSRQEAEAIQGLWRPGEVLSSFDFAANREVLKDERWRQALILHFATHSLLDDRQPELSGLVFSLVGPDGAPRPGGFLRLHEIYDLDLNAHLVVLSACQTGVGKELRGEGLLGMTWGFMSIGVPQLVVSLWKVEDRATAELMSRFYRELFNGERPPEALQRAQKSMLEDPQWSDPTLWAGFIFLGDYERRGDGGIETADTGGHDSEKRAGTGGMPPPKVRPKPKPRPPKPPTAKKEESSESSLAKSLGDASPSESLQFAAYSPSEIYPVRWHSLLAYCFREGVVQAVTEDSERRLGIESEGYTQAQASAVMPIATGSEVVIIPELAGCRFNPPQVSLFWFEDWHCAEFRFQAVPNLLNFPLERDLPGRLSFYVNSVLTADISFHVRLTDSARAQPDKARFQRTEAQPYQSVFISYSHSDSRVVEILEQLYGSIGFTALRDIHFLRPGEKWQPRLLEKIEEADIFQLFWSNNAKRSDSVEVEWRHALGLQRPLFVRPVYWEQPRPEPPRELQELHFHQLLLKSMNLEEIG